MPQEIPMSNRMGKTQKINRQLRDYNMAVKKNVNCHRPSNNLFLYFVKSKHKVHNNYLP